MDKNKNKLIIAMLIFGTIGLVRRYIPFSSGLVALVRGVIGVSFLLSSLFFKKDKLSFSKAKNNILLLILSGVCLAVNWILLFEAYRFTSVAVATICYYMAPVFLILVSPVLFHEKITIKKVICLIVAVAGLVMVSDIGSADISGIRGIIFGLSAAVLYAAVVTLNKMIGGIGAKERTVFQLGIASIVLIPYVIISDNGVSYTMDWRSICLLLVIGIVHTGIAYSLYFDSIHNVTAQTAALLSYIDPVVAVLLSALVLQEGLSLTAGIGVVLVIGAAVISEIN